MYIHVFFPASLAENVSRTPQISDVLSLEFLFVFVCSLKFELLPKGSNKAIVLPMESIL